MTTAKQPDEKPRKARTLEGAEESLRLDGLGQGLALKAAGLGGVLLALSVGLGAAAGDQFRHFLFSYLVAFMFVLAICLGGLYWVTLQHLVNAHWSVAVRRIGELFAGALPLLVVLCLPVVVPTLLGYSGLFRWVDDQYMASVASLAHKKPYLNLGFFAVRCLAYFAFWAVLGHFLLRRSTAQDQSANSGALDGVRKIAPPAMLGFAITLTFASIDFIMTLDPSWFSTIFGVYYFAGCVLSIHSTIVLVLMFLQSRGRLTRSVTVHHFHDLGKMMFAFVVFWSYIAFSQFMLIWYANIPEETAWYRVRMQGAWGWVSLALLFGHFLVPFLGLISRHVKRHRVGLVFWAVWLLVFEYIDLYWLIMPNLSQDQLPFGVIDVTLWASLVSFLIAGVAWLARNRNLLPIRDPRLAKSLAFENV